MVMRLNDRSAASCTSDCSSAGAIAASVATKPSMVAMFGRIMPAPLLMPVTVTGTPSIMTRRDAALGTVSVVMIASAASAQFAGFASASAAGNAASMRSFGSGSMITPVENGSTCDGCTPSSRPTATQVERAPARPAEPVPAFALPVLTTMPRMALSGRQVLRLMLAQVCVHSAMTGTRLAAPLLALKLGYSAAAVGVLLALFALSAVFLALPAGRLADRHGLHLPLALAVSAAMLGAGLAAAWPVFAVLCASALLVGAAANAAQISNLGMALTLLFGILGGSFLPLNTAGPLLNWLSRITPNRWALDGFTALAAGEGPAAVFGPVAALLAMAVVLFVAAALLFRRRQGTLLTA